MNAGTTKEEMLEWDDEKTDSIALPTWMGFAALFLFFLVAILFILAF